MTVPFENADTIWGGLGGAAVGALGSVAVAWLRRKPIDVSLQEAANIAVKTALDGYKDYIKTMTSSYERRIEGLTKEYEDKIIEISSSYEDRIRGLTAEIHSLRDEIKLFSERQLASTVAVSANSAALAALQAQEAHSTPAVAAQP